LCSSVTHLTPSGCLSSSHHFHTSCGSSFFFRPPPFWGLASVDFGVAFFPVALGDFASFFSEVGVALALAFGVGVAFDFEATLLFLGVKSPSSPFESLGDFFRFL
jgi:hypothetical protein